MFLRENSSRAKNAIALIYIVMIVDFFSIISSCLQYNLLNDFVNDFYISDAEINTNDQRESFIGYLYFIVYAISIYFFISWFRRAYFNLHTLVKNCTFSEGWAAGAWFVPIINLGRPMRIMQELYSKSIALLLQNQIKFENKRTFVGVWWTLWLLFNIISNIANRLQLQTESVERLMDITLLQIVSNILFIICGFFAIKVIKDYAEIETALQRIKLNKSENKESIIG